MSGLPNIQLTFDFLTVQVNWYDNADCAHYTSKSGNGKAHSLSPFTPVQFIIKPEF